MSSKRPADVALAFGGAVSSDDLKALAKFEELVRKYMLGISVPAPCALKATTNERDATCEAIIDFYHACATSSIPEVKLVGKKAMKACSLLISSSNVESSFCHHQQRGPQPAPRWRALSTRATSTTWPC